jgi:hypothetical protein
VIFGVAISDAGNRERHVAQRDLPADGTGRAAKDLVGEVAADHRLIRVFVEHLSWREVPRIHMRETRTDALHPREGPCVATRQERSHREARAEIGDARDARADRLAILRRESGRRTGPCHDADAFAATRVVARLHVDEIRARGRNLTLHRRACSGPERDHSQHGAHADDDAEHGEQSAQAVSVQRADREAHIDR